MGKRIGAGLCFVGAAVGVALAMIGAKSGSPPDASVNRLTAREIRLIDEHGRAVLTMGVEDGRAVVRLLEPDGTERRFLSEVIETADQPAPAQTAEAAEHQDGASPNAAPASDPQEPWEQSSAWDQMVLHSSKDAVEKLLGTPRDVRKTSSGETWVYGPGTNGRGRVYFDSGNRVTGWYEPRPSSGEGG